MPPTFDPLNNTGTSQVLFLLVRGKTSPMTIASELDLKPPSVIDQLQRLIRARIVRLGKRVGKQRNYEINWNQLISITIRRALRLPQIELLEQGGGHTLAADVLDKASFRDFVRDYLTILIGEHPFELLRKLRFADIITDLDATIVGMMSDPDFAQPMEDAGRKTRDEKLAELYFWLSRWTEARRHVSTPSKGAFVRALSKSGFEIDGYAYQS
ncbi:MAG: hypothetical protein ABSF82_03450 [Candidatus Bathyarchaeia archaeon]|jgi:hypothetical protein